MNETQMMEVVKKIASMQCLSAQDDITWAAANVAYHRCRMHEFALRASAIPEVENWPKKWGLSTTLTVALILDRHDVLQRKGFSIAEALDRVGPAYSSMLLEIESTLRASGNLPVGKAQ